MFLKRNIEDYLKYPSQLFDSYNKNKYEEHLNYLYGSIDRVKELENTNEILNKSKLSPCRFYEGRFYIFNYQYMNDKKQRDYIDVRPFIFTIDEYYSINQDIKIKGINFNFLPPETKMIFLELYFKIFFKRLEQDIINFEENNIQLFKFTRKENEFFLSELNRLFPLISKAIRYWDRKRIIYNSIDFVRPQDYNILFDYSDYEKSIKGKSWKEVQSKIFN